MVARTVASVALAALAVIHVVDLPGRSAHPAQQPIHPVAQAIDGSANVIITAIDQVLHEDPSHG